MSDAVQGHSLELFFIEGRPDGMLTAKVFNWTGHVRGPIEWRLPDGSLTSKDWEARRLSALSENSAESSQ